MSELVELMEDGTFEYYIKEIDLNPLGLDRISRSLSG